MEKKKQTNRNCWINSPICVCLPTPNHPVLLFHCCFFFFLNPGNCWVHLGTVGKTDKRRDEGSAVAQALAGRGSGVVSAPLNFIVITLKNDTASSSDLQVTLNRREWAAHWMSELQSRSTLRNLRTGQAETSWSSARRNAKFCIRGRISSACEGDWKFKRIQKL